MNDHIANYGVHPSGGVSSAQCAAEGCFYVFYAGVQTAPFYADHFRRDHGRYFEPGTTPALPIEVDWEPSAHCPVCADGIGDIKIDADGEGLICEPCGTRWSMDGTGGERADE